MAGLHELRSPNETANDQMALGVIQALSSTAATSRLTGFPLPPAREAPPTTTAAKVLSEEHVAFIASTKA